LIHRLESAATPINDKDSLQTYIRGIFRSGTTEVDDKKNEMVSDAIEGLKLLHLLDVDGLPIKKGHHDIEFNTDNDTDGSSSNNKNNQDYHDESNPQHWLESVEWLRPLSEMSDSTIDVNTMQFPVFPLVGPVFPATFPVDQRVPLITQFSDIPVSGMEIPLKIFEPRYRKMYNDMLSTSSSSPVAGRSSKARFIVPFCHPYHMGQFATYGWLYEIMHVRDIADETNGRYQLVCNHLVTSPVKIHSIINPSEFDKKKTYLLANAEIIDGSTIDDDDDADADTAADTSSKSTDSKRQGLQQLETLLRQLQEQASDTTASEEKCLIDRMLMALGEGSIWSVAQVWISNLQMTILQIQAQIANKVQLQATAQTTSPKKVTEEMILLAQAPHKEELQSMLMEVSTLVPLLLQDGSEKLQSERLCQRIEERLEKKLRRNEKDNT
jgi:Lon protease-like protein